MTYRNLPRVVLGVLSLVLLVTAAIILLIGARMGDDLLSTDSTGIAVGLGMPLSAAFWGGLFAVAGVVTGASWILARSVNYDAWFRATNPDAPLHVEQQDGSGYSRAEWDADRRPER